MVRSVRILRSRWALEALALAGAAALALVFAAGDVLASTKADKCNTYARDAVANTPTSTGAGRGAARGAIIGGIAGNAGAGAATGAVVGGARRANQKAKSYQYYYDSCMRR
jgi:hypothetical protein